MVQLPSFETPDLAAAVELLQPDEVDQLDFGAVCLDAFGIVRVRNRAEDELFPQKISAVGRLFFTDVAPCLNNSHFKGRIDKARAAGTLDIGFKFTRDFEKRDLRVRVQSGKESGTWIFISP